MQTKERTTKGNKVRRFDEPKNSSEKINEDFQRLAKPGATKERWYMKPSDDFYPYKA